MKNLVILFIMFCCQISVARDKSEQQQKAKILYKNLNVTAEYQIGNFVSFVNGIINTRTRYGQGAELSLKYRVSKTLTFNIGFHLRSYLMDLDRYNSSLQTLYSSPGSYTSIVHYQNGDQSGLTQFGFGPSMGRIFKFDRIRLEPYFKINTSFFTYSIDSRAYVRNVTTDEFRIYNVNGRRNQLAVLPALGFHLDVVCTKLLSATLGIESGYNVGSQYFSTSYAGGSAKIQNQQTKITAPKSYILAGFGIVLRPFNRIKPSESEYSNEEYLKRFDKNQ